MLAKRIIPCLDVDAGRVVKGTKFIDLKDAGDPVEVAARYDQEGADELVFLDITASSDNRQIMLDVVTRTAESIFMPLTVGGGIRTLKDIEALLHSGADRVSINTSAVERPEFVKEAALRFGSQCIVVAIDAKRKQEQGGFKMEGSSGLITQYQGVLNWQVYTHGGRTRVDLDAIQWAQEVESLGAGEILLTSMDNDGTQDGYDINLTKSIAQKVNIPIIASGGAGKLEHFYQILTEGEANAALAASLFHYRKLEIKQVKEYLRHQGVVVRL